MSHASYAICPHFGAHSDPVSTFETSPFPQLGEVSKALTGGKQRGGARNRANRESYALTAANISNLRAAKGHAEWIGQPFTRMITIHWESAGVPLVNMVQATSRFVDLLSKTLARHGCETTWLWVLENGDDKGGHCHLLAHVPADLVQIVTDRQKRWLRRITGKPYKKDVIFSRPVGLLLGLEESNPDLHAINLEVAFGYMCKGAPQDVLNAAGIIRAHQKNGRVIGRRCSTSQNIGPKARRGVGY